MKRREFLINSTIASSATFMLAGIPIAKASPLLDKFASLAEYEDRVLILIQLNGGNDGLNTLIPLEYYSNLSKARANILVPENEVLKLTNETGLHPSMTGMNNLFKEGKLSAINSVGYPDPNFSHFRSIDIWTSASDSNKVLTSGWLGRYLADKHPDYPTNYPSTVHPDPLSISIGSSVSTTCQGPIFNMGMAIQATPNFYDLTSGGEDVLPEGYMGEEIDYIRTVISQTQVYSSTLKDANSKGKNLSSKYKEDSLSQQLKLVARLISGGLKTKIYVCNIVGFDTHSNQIAEEGGVLGSHATLLANLSNAIEAFQDDLKLLSLEDRVLGMTFSEFGRRIISNSSLGTDHGAAAPMFLFGSKVISALHGHNPEIPVNADAKTNIPMQYDFRSIYYSILKDWFGLTNQVLDDVMLREFPSIQLVQKLDTSINDRIGFDFNINISPNPISSKGTISFVTEGGAINISLFDSRGIKINQLYNGYTNYGHNDLMFNTSSYSSGIYYIRIESEKGNQVKVLNIIK